MTKPDLPRRLMAEFVGTGFLLATVVGSGIMADNLAGGNVAIALMGNTIPTGAILFVLILIFGGLSGAHFNPAVTLTFRLRGDMSTRDALLYVAIQILGGLVGVVMAHIMFDLPIGQISQTVRSGPGQWVSEWVATFGLVMTILGGIRFAPKAVPAAVGLYITAAYWFTASTSFANPAVTIARSFSNTFAGIQPADMPLFIVAQLVGAVCATLLFSWLFEGKRDTRQTAP
jgi:glycerol uptake facilitator-like aquaporin